MQSLLHWQWLEHGIKYWALMDRNGQLITGLERANITTGKPARFGCEYYKSHLVLWFSFYFFWFLGAVLAFQPPVGVNPGQKVFLLRLDNSRSFQTRYSRADLSLSSSTQAERISCLLLLCHKLHFLSFTLSSFQFSCTHTHTHTHVHASTHTEGGTANSFCTCSKTA